MELKKNKQDILTHINFHRFMEIKDAYHPIEIAQELGISLREVNKLRKRTSHT